jgi:hypothetical protein
MTHPTFPFQGEGNMGSAKQNRMYVERYFS